MKGYLERLVRSATNPAESVRPWTRSVFDVGSKGDFQVAPPQDSASSAAMESPEPVSLDSAESSQARVSPRSLRPGSDRNSSISESQLKHSSSGAEQPGQSADRGPSFLNKRLSPELLITNNQRSGRDIEETKETETTTPRTKGSQRNLTDRRTEPLASGKAANKSGKVPPEWAAGSRRSSLDKSNSTAVRSGAAFDRQTDEIQIHIGRIEVSAVHPPVSKAPKAREEQISLEAYLKRRDGRAG
jgi:hypothetical protein